MESLDYSRQRDDDENMRNTVEVRSTDFVGVVKLFWYVINNPRGVYDACKFVWLWMKTNEFRKNSKVLPYSMLYHESQHRSQ